MEFEIWAEKYRPKRLSEIINQKHVVERLKAFVEEGTIPHMIFAGPPGVGKTSLAIIVAYELYGENWRQNVLEMNASDQRRIEDIRTRVKEFARIKPIGKVPFKIILMDEADALTAEAQQALRRMMEDYAAITRFILTCVTGDTKVHLPNETYVKMEDLIRHKEVLSVSGKDKVLAFIELDPKIVGKKVYAIRTDTGRELKATEDHPLLTTSGWKKVSELKIGDKLVVYPALETEWEEEDGIILDEKAFLDVYENYEIEYLNKKPLGKAKRFRELTSNSKQKILEFVLSCVQTLDQGLTEKEYEVYKVVEENPRISRKEIQEKLKLSRARVDELLRSLVKKRLLERFVEGKTHRFIVVGKGEKLRNLMDVKRLVEEKFGIKISYSAVKRMVKEKKILVDSLEELKNLGLIPLRYDNKHIDKIARLVGVLFGDGHLGKRPTVWFTSDEKMLQRIKEDLEEIGFNFSMIGKKRVSGVIRGRPINGITAYIHSNSRAVWLFFKSLGVPIGDKTENAYRIPAWILFGTKLVKREFLRGFFDSELLTPKIKDRTIRQPKFVQHKVLELQDNLKLFAEDIKNMLKEFEIDSGYKLKEGGKRKDGERVVELQFNIYGNHRNLLKLFSRIGFYYHEEKELLSRYFSEYFRYKFELIKERMQKAKMVLELASAGFKKAQIAKQLGVTLDFVSDRLEGKEVDVPYDYPCFEEWIKERKIGKGFLWAKVKEIEEIKVNKVFDILCVPSHTFLANGIVSHNCNYSSKIIEPLQSRCAVFKFRALGEEDVREFIDRIVKGEKLKVDEKAIKAVINLSEGDLRRVANLLQAAAIIDKKITEEAIYDVASKARPTDVKEMLDLALKGKFKEARQKLQDMLLIQGLSGLDIIAEIHRQIYSLDLPEEDKVKLIEKCGEYEFRISEGANEMIQLEALLASFLLHKRK